MKRELRIALPKGRMSEESLEFLYNKGISSIQSFPNGRKLIHKDEKTNIEFLLVRSKDVGTYVEKGACDMGVIGYDLLEEHNFDVFVPAALPFGECRLSIASHAGNDEWSSRRNIKVATKYPNLTSRYFFDNGFHAQIIELYGSIEIAPLTGIADAIVDLVSTGQTLKENNLKEDRVILESSARLILNRSSYAFRIERINDILSKI